MVVHQKIYGVEGKTYRASGKVLELGQGEAGKGQDRGESEGLHVGYLVGR
jgi:hypothetical protein